MMLSSSQSQRLGPKGSGLSLMVERSRINTQRNPTPDSEALASSDEEHENGVSGPTKLVQRGSSSFGWPGRRPSTGSWLSEVHSGPSHGTFSVGGASMVSNGSQPSTPNFEHAPRSANRSSFTGGNHWAGTMWSLDSSRREGRSRLTELVQSPNNMTAYCVDDDMQSPRTRDFPGESAFPFPIPLQPVIKNVRSQSYSVGQVDPESTVVSSSMTRNLPASARTRGGGSQIMRGRASRPSLLAEPPHDGMPLDLVLEDDDDSDQGVKLDFNANSLLRQAAVENARSRHRASTASISPNSRVFQRDAKLPRQHAWNESDFAIDEFEDNTSDKPDRQGAVLRRHSEFVPHMCANHESTDIHDPISTRRTQWQSALGYGTSEPTRRRRSFAHPDTQPISIPAPGRFYDVQSRDDVVGQEMERIPSLSSIATSQAGGDENDYMYFQPLKHGVENSDEDLALNARSITSYFSGCGPVAKSSHANNLLSQEFDIVNTLPQHTNSTAANNYVTSGSLGKQPKILYIVTFKCARSDIFYIPVNTGLDVKQGDLVVVDGDRGFDLGTVTHCNVSMSEAKRLKEESANDHFKWLIMFSKHVKLSGNVNPSSTLTVSDSECSNIGGKGSRSIQGISPHGEGEIKPKMIKRLAQNHEIQQLREKEGAEAKAKRFCQQKVLDHGLAMEILDAEYQFDNKKLTFFYYAENYINFNDLVTDLFKSYKTRLWMSAINPASFATPSGVLSQYPAPSIGSVGRSSLRVTQNELGSQVNSGYGQSQMLSTYGPIAPAATMLGPGYGQFSAGIPATSFKSPYCQNNATTISHGHGHPYPHYVQGGPPVINQSSHLFGVSQGLLGTGRPRLPMHNMEDHPNSVQRQENPWSEAFGALTLEDSHSGNLAGQGITSRFHNPTRSQIY